MFTQWILLPYAVLYIFIFPMESLDANTVEVNNRIKECKILTEMLLLNVFGVNHTFHPVSYAFSCTNLLLPLSKLPTVFRIRTQTH